jgi:hypothetical protein
MRLVDKPKSSAILRRLAHDMTRVFYSLKRYQRMKHRRIVLNCQEETKLLIHHQGVIHKSIGGCGLGPKNIAADITP